MHPVRGSQQIAQARVDFARQTPNLTIMEGTVNGQAGLIARQEGRTMAVLAVGVSGERITDIWIVLNPEKLQSWTS